MQEWFTQMRLRLKALLWRRKLDRDLEDELGFHLAMRGDTPEARKRFGNATLAKEQTRGLWTFVWLESLGQDLRYAGRLLRKSPVFTAAAILSLALGIGANAAIFSLINALLIRTLLVQNPEELVVFGNPGYAYFRYKFYRDNNRVFSGIFATDNGQIANVSMDAGDNERAQVELVSGSYFPTLGVTAAAGRILEPDDDRTPGAHPVAVVSYSYWNGRFGRDPRVLGKTIRISQHPFTIIGVASPGFSGVEVDSATEIWVPIMMQGAVRPGRDWLTRVAGSTTNWLQILGRLKPNLRPEDAEPSVQALYAHDEIDRSGGKLTPEISRELERNPFKLLPASHGLSSLRRSYRLPLQFLLTASGLVLLIACANLANLLLARAGARRREIGMRLSLGASRGRLVRQMLTESALLSICGTMLGLLIANWGTRILLQMVSTGDEAVPLYAGPDFRFLGFMTIVCVITTLLFGLWPALRATKVDVSPSLKLGGAISGRERSYANRLFTLVQVSLSVVLLCGAGIFLRSLGNLRQIDSGIRAERLIQLDVDPLTAGYKGAAFRQVCQRLLDRIAAIPGVQSATFSDNGVFSGRNSTGMFQVPGSTPRVTDYDVVAAGYFSTLGIGMLAGRDFVPQDSETAPKVIIVNEALAHRFFSDGAVVGRKIDYNGSTWEIVGLVRDARDHGLRRPPRRQFYMPFLQVQPELFSVRFLVRTSAKPDILMTLLRQIVRSENPSLPVLSVNSIPVLIDRQLAVERMLATLAGYFAVLALLVTAIGLYGVLSYEVVRRTKEIGIRIALGAMRTQILWLVTAESVGLVFAGVALGVAGALALSKWIQSLLFEIKPNDPVSIIAAIGVLVLGAIPAALVPAWRAARLDPTGALREE